MESPRPGVVAKSNSFEIYWNNTLVGTVARSGQNVAQPQWRTVSFPVTGTGTDRISFREYDSDSKGALIDDVRLIAN